MNFQTMLLIFFCPKKMVCGNAFKTNRCQDILTFADLAILHIVFESII